MTMTTAENQGLVFEGRTARYYSNEEIEQLKTEAKKIRALGFRALAVKSLKSEWGGGDYVLMVDPQYSEYEDAQSHLYYIQNEEAFIKSIKEEAERKIKEIKEKAEKYRNECIKYNIKY